jgi:spore coat polysaccharide biosynthesis protein SpsF (cytidylyltransferase family)
MRIGAIVQARMTSSRLPGKVLRSMHGRPMLQYLLERLERAPGLSETVVATSTDRSDDPIEQFCRDAGVACVRGSLADVASRFLEVLETHPLDAFVRICADSPLLDQRIVEAAIQSYTTRSVDIVTNKLPKTYPSGQSVEVIRSDVFKAVSARLSAPHDREHVTPFFYRNQDEFRFHSLISTPDLGTLHMAVDTPADFERVTAMLAAMDRPHWDYDLTDLLNLSAAVGTRESA